jgi:very-short-patch-repair endonuclease
MSKIELLKIRNEKFGKITIIKNIEDYSLMFIAKEIGDMWGHSNIKQAVTRILDDSEFKIIKYYDNPEIFKCLIDSKEISSKTRRLQLITIDGLIKMTMNTDRLFDKIEFMNFLKDNNILNNDVVFLKQRKEIEFAEVLIPFINALGYNVFTQYIFGDYRFDFYIDELKICIEFDENAHKYQKDSDSKRDVFLLLNGIKTIRLNENNKIGKNLAILSMAINTNPELACSMSFVDDLVKKGFDFNTVSELALKSAVPLFKGMIEIGITPSELKK